MNSRFVSLGIAIALLGAGCDDANHEDQSVPYKHKGEYQTASCQYGFTDGGQADRPGSPDYRKFLFDKELDYAMIRAVAKASASATLEFVQDQGVLVYATHDADSASCAMFNSLPEAPSDLKDKFTDAGSGAKDGSFIVGLFIPKDTEVVPSTTAAAEIGMRRDANRWTLVHEFSHFLFDTDFRRTGGQHSDDLKKHYSENINAYNAAARAYQRSQTQQTFDTATTEMKGAYATSREVVIRYFAEEMTIETMLRNGVYTGELEYLPFEKVSSYSYIASSGDAAVKELNKFSDELDHLITEAADKSFWQDYDKLQDVRNDLNTFKSKITDIASDAAQYESASDFVDEAEPVRTPCHHVREAQELTEGAKLGADFAQK